MLYTETHTLSTVLSTSTHTLHTVFYTETHTQHTMLYTDAETLYNVFYTETHTLHTVLYTETHTLRTVLSTDKHTLQNVLYAEADTHFLPPRPNGRTRVKDSLPPVSHIFLFMLALTACPLGYQEYFNHSATISNFKLHYASYLRHIWLNHCPKPQYPIPATSQIPNLNLSSTYTALNTFSCTYS